MKNLYLITGFLGAGKTTFINSLLSGYGKKTAVIVNEFGKQGIDGKLIGQNDGIQIEEINNGSIFCCCRMLDFANALVEMSKTDVETVFVEASGLADPSNLEDILTGANSGCGNEYVFCGSICIVDAQNYLQLSTALPVLISQAEYADYIIVNKSDLTEESILKLTEEKLREINPSADIFKTKFAKLPELPGEIVQPKPSHPSRNTPTNRPKTDIVYPKPFDNKSFGRFVARISKKAYRAKGFITLNGEKKFLDVVNGTHRLSPSEENSEDKVVLLSMPKK